MEADALKDESADLLGSDTEEPEKEPRSLGIAPSELHRIPSENSGKKSFYIYDQRSDGVFKQIVKVIAFQRAIGISAVFDPEGIKAGFKNISWFIISTESPAMTYVIDCYRVDLHEVFLDLRRILQNPLVLKIVYGVKETLGYLYQVQHVEVQNVIDLQIADKVLRRLHKGPDVGLATLAELIRIYVKDDFAETALTRDEEAGGKNSELDHVLCAESAAMQGAFLIDIFQGQQQICIGSVVQRLGPEIRSKMEVFKKSCDKPKSS